MFGYLTDIEGDLFGQFRRLQQEMDSLFNTRTGPASIRAVRRGSYPPINVGGTANEVDVYLYVSGIDPDKLDISIQKNLLTISGERKTERPENVTFYLRERFDGGFRRVINLPDDVDPDRVEAKYKDGILHIRIQRQEAVKPRKIQVS